MFNHNDIADDDSFCYEADPMLQKAMKKTASAQVLQDIGLNVYYANTAGGARHEGIRHLLLKELGENMGELMRTRLSYREMEEYLSVVGYEIGDIRCVFRDLTGIDPVKLDYMRNEDAKNVPCNIPGYTLAWGKAKKAKEQSYFCVPVNMLYTVYHQQDDMTRVECGTFLTEDAALEHMGTLVSHLHRYDKPVAQQVAEAMEPIREESTKPQYKVMANHLYAMRQRSDFDPEAAKRMVASAVFSGTLTESEGNDLIELYAAPMPPGPANQPGDDDASDLKPAPEMDYVQDHRDVMEEVERVTPQDFFAASLPDRMDQVTPEHIKQVLTYVSHRQKDMGEFDVKLHKLEYSKHETPQVLVETNPQSGRPSGPPRATISVVLEVEDRTLPAEKNRKYGLSVFFVSPDGEIGTSDSIKGEDDIIYGFSEDGMRQYFAKERMSSGLGK